MIDYISVNILITFNQEKIKLITRKGDDKHFFHCGHDHDFIDCQGRCDSRQRIATALGLLPGARLLHLVR